MLTEKLFYLSLIVRRGSFVFQPNTFSDRLRSLLQLVLTVGLSVLFYRFFFRPLLPLIIAFVLSSLITAPAQKLQAKCRLPMGVCALLMTVLLVISLLTGGYFLCKLALQQLKTFFLQLPDFFDGLQQSLIAIQTKLERWFPQQRALPKFLSPSEWLEGIHAPEIHLDTLTSSLGWAATSLPNLLLTAVFILAAAVMLTSRRQEIFAFVNRQLPAKLLTALRKLRQYLLEALAGWCKAQGILAAVTFGILLAGFFFLRIQAAVLLAFLVAVLDALPVLGAGLFLIPWALMELLLGNTGRAAGLGLLFAAILTVRNALEPHVVGKQIGLHPFVSLLCFYYGWRLAGIPGMVLLPCLILILVKLQEWGYSKLWR